MIIICRILIYYHEKFELPIRLSNRTINQIPDPMKPLDEIFLFAPITHFLVTRNSAMSF